MKITWQVDDGYVGGRRPQTLDIDDSEFEGMDEEEKKEYIHDCVQQDFDDKVSWEILETEE